MSGLKQADQIPRAALAWIIAAQALLLVPHLPRVPVWVVLLYLAAFIWRIQVFRGRLEMPGNWIKVALAVGTAVGIYLSFGSLLGMEPMVAFLLTAFALKLTELRSQKDAYVVVFLGHFVLLTTFLFSQDLLLVIYGVLLVWVLTTALVSVHRVGASLRDLQPARLAGVMLLQSFPLMLVLFFLFPRIGPLWTVPLMSHSAKTGMSDNLRPGDVSNLSRSDEVAFRVRFDGDIPPSAQLYWRGIVMSQLQGGAWRSLRYYEVPALERRRREPEPQGNSLAYDVMLSPTQQNWLYSLRYARTPRSGVMSLPDFRLYSPVEIENDFLYRVRSWPTMPLGLQLSDWRRRLETSLPSEDNPRTVALARELRASVDSDAAFSNAVLAYFQANDFRYTLQPPLLPAANSMDSFLFQSRRGFCEHFAYAYAVMMRAAGIPARIVAGYLGGEVNPVNRTVIVHQFDAHAWNEIWLEGQGWVRVDPTSAVAPDRIAFGLEQALSTEGSFLADSPLSPLRFRGVGWVNAARLRYDALTYRWQSWVTGFDGAAQIDVLKSVLGEVSVVRSLALLMGTGVLVMSVVALLLLRQRPRRQRPAFEAELLRFQALMWRRGLEPRPGETPAMLAERAAERWPRDAERIRSLYRTLARRVYGAALPVDDHRLRRSVHKQLRALRFTLQFTATR